MSAGQFEFAEWQAPLEELMLEFDRTKLPAKLQVAETAIYGRLQQLGSQDNGDRERESLNCALLIIEIISRERLGFAEGSRAMGID
jgi:hypothetical protein